MVVLIAIIVGVLYLAAVWLLAVVFRPAQPPDGPSGKVVVGLIALWTGGYTVGDVLSGVRGRRSRVSSTALASEPWPLAPDP